MGKHASKYKEKLPVGERLYTLIDYWNRLSVQEGGAVEIKLFSRDRKLGTPFSVTTFPLHVPVDVNPANYIHHFLKYMVANGVDLNALDNSGYAPLHFAAMYHNINVTRALLEAGADVNVQSNSIVFSHGRVWVEMIHTCRYESNTFPMHLALKKEYHDCTAHGKERATILVDLVKILLSHGTDYNLLDDYGHTPLHYAVLLNDVTLIDVLLDAGADVNMRTQEKENRSNVPLYYIDNFMPGSYPENITPMFYAKDVSMLKFLLSRNADTEIININGDNLLHRSIQSSGRLEVITYLVLNMPVLLHAKNVAHRTPLTNIVRQFAIRYQKERQDKTEEVIHLMLKAGCHPATELELESWLRLKLLSPSEYSSGGDELLRAMEQISCNPRSLLDLCTIRIRSTLQKNISSAVEFLPLPYKLKQLLKLLQIF